ncbi:integrase [Kitasatospora sp. A2-31]|uniref:integrase n=1 Tax=Kitasatospora sp. A2-31 TaxID=2916414 RepID=UPI001EEA6E15|nr:integrase [Kitasatospora sp. A2-31]MCG6496867.1 integrase [Kitasatospora sp. A2-31]
MALTASDQFHPAMTIAELINLPACVTLATANRALGLGRTAGYGLAKSGQYPVPLIRAGRGYRVSSIEVAKILGLTVPDQVDVPANLRAIAA